MLFQRRLPLFFSFRHSLTKSLNSSSSWIWEEGWPPPFSYLSLPLLPVIILGSLSKLSFTLWRLHRLSGLFNDQSYCSFPYLFTRFLNYLSQQSSFWPLRICSFRFLSLMRGPLSVECSGFSGLDFSHLYLTCYHLYQCYSNKVKINWLKITEIYYFKFWRLEVWHHRGSSSKPLFLLSSREGSFLVSP